ncbi:hypothetical protein ONA91_14935 [Micromonospora sp. DR5-3]|uniref:hypothetical protein n=1 Tax=unclassified Micromonospora TaxID=2617518 RepID=UPI0011D8F3E2|nr:MULTISPECIES: hypothetical protein [unclassified Micromonospora]MCW3815747.1 hypothetical protein [Micromonospora sp. DR5-3]TYC19673.1 hypothetical protein FXF52_35400 [Micromonospora sp. MP36]
MGWFLVVTPLHQAAVNGGLEWAADAECSFGLPEDPPPVRELPTVEQVLLAFCEAGCHGTPWFQVAGHDLIADLPDCPDPAMCASVGGLDLGEVRLGVDGASVDEPVELHQAVTDIGFRKPSSRAVLAASVALASQAGPLLVLDDSGACAFVVSPGDDPANLAQHWPW